jgi:hypothetical protein
MELVALGIEQGSPSRLLAETSMVLYLAESSLLVEMKIIVSQGMWFLFHSLIFSLLVFQLMSLEPKGKSKNFGPSRIESSQ